jgi:hypothetical protein
VIYESLQLSGTARNAERLGLYVAWLVSNSLLAESTEQSAGRAVAHLRMQALTGTFNEDYAGCDYTGENEWHRYDELAPKISAAFRRFREPASKLKQGIAKILQFPSRKKKP